MLLFLCLIFFISHEAFSCSVNTTIDLDENSPHFFKYPQTRTDYPTNQERCWLLKSSVSRPILISFTVTVINNDKFKIYNGETTGDPNLFDVTGGAVGRSAKLLASSGSALVYFSSDNTADPGNDDGFTLHAVTGSGTTCGVNPPNALEKTDQYLTSPGFPNAYGLSTSCSWFIIADDLSAGLELELKFLDVEYRPNCDYDYLQIIDEVGEGTKKLCGTDWFPTTKYKTESNTVEVKLVSDSIDAKYGFVVVYRQVGDLVDIYLVIASIILTSLSLLGCIWGSLYCVDRL